MKWGARCGGVPPSGQQALGLSTQRGTPEAPSSQRFPNPFQALIKFSQQLTGRGEAEFIGPTVQIRQLRPRVT